MHESACQREPVKGLLDSVPDLAVIAMAVGSVEHDDDVRGRRLEELADL
jgi:hypothetical protein